MPRHCGNVGTSTTSWHQGGELAVIHAESAASFSDEGDASVCRFKAGRADPATNDNLVIRVPMGQYRVRPNLCMGCQSCGTSGLHLSLAQQAENTMTLEMAAISTATKLFSGRNGIVLHECKLGDKA